MALRSHVVEAAGVRPSERRRAWGDSSKRASEPDAEPPPRARWSTHYSPRAPVSLTRRLRRAVAVWPEEPGLTPAPTLLRRRHLLLHGHRLARRRHARRRHARRRHAAVPPAQRRLRLACAAPPAQRCLCRDAYAATPTPRRLRRDAYAATPHAALPRAAPPRPAPPRTAPPGP
jgi:hypothetical protein